MTENKVPIRMLEIDTSEIHDPGAVLCRGEQSLFFDCPGDIDKAWRMKTGGAGGLWAVLVRFRSGAHTFKILSCSQDKPLDRLVDDDMVFMAVLVTTDSRVAMRGVGAQIIKCCIMRETGASDDELRAIAAAELEAQIKSYNQRKARENN